MRRFYKILRYIFPKYTTNALLKLLFVILYAVFGLFSFIQVIPFLGILFKNQPIVNEPVPYELNFEALQHNFNYFLSKVIVEQGEVKALLYVSLFTLIAVLLKNVFLYFSKFFMVPLRNGVVRDIRNKIYDKITRLQIGYFSNERKGDIISRMTNDVQEIEVSVIRSIDVMFQVPVTVITYLVSLIVISPRLTVYVFIMLPLTGLVIGWIGKSLRKRSTLAQQKIGEILSIIEETLTGLRIIKAFNAEKRVSSRFGTANQEYTTIMNKMWRRRDMAVPMSEFLGTIAVVCILWLGAKIVLAGTGDFTSQELIGYLVIFSQIINPSKALSQAYYNILKGIASAERIDEVLDAEITIVEKPGAVSLKSFEKKIEYQDVRFKYVDDMVIDGISLNIPKGKTVALVGQSGSGKSTLVDLLPRFYDVLNGQIKIDNVDVKDYKIADLRRLMGIVNQESILFNDTIFNNISFGVESATEDQVIAAAKIANAHQFIMETPDGYHTNIGDRGSKLSGGQRQRISIARAVLANPPILILDEATSALDTESEQLVQESIVRLMKNRTSIVIAHRLSTVVHADLICVLHEGRIVEQGTHAELIKANGYYKKLHDAQTFA